MTQLDLFEWADSRPSAEVINWIPHIARRMWRERTEPIAHREGRLIDFPPAMPDVRRTA